jgi:hypothetical protein
MPGEPEHYFESCDWQFGGVGQGVAGARIRRKR